MGNIEEFSTEFGKEIRWCSKDTLSGRIVEVKKNVSFGEKLMENERVCFYLEKGNLELEYNLPGLGKKIVKLTTGDNFYLPPTSEYRIQTMSKCKLIFIKVVE